MINTRLKELLDKYLDGTASEAEIREVDEWYATFSNAPGLTEQLTPEQRTALEQLLFLRISRGVEEAETPVRVMKSHARYWWAAASIALLLAAGGYFIVRNNSIQPDKTIIALTEETSTKSIKKIRLPDGTTAWLNSGSKIKYTQENGRELWLEGEGYFEVAQKAGEAFVVHTGTLDVNVLGTSFNIDAYTPGDRVTVSVASGKVAVGNARITGATLTANQQAIYQPASGKLEKNEVTAADFSAWRQGQLVFKAAMFRNIAQKLERRYDVRIRFSSPHIANALLTARFDENMPLTEVLDMLCAIYGFSYRQQQGENEYIVYDKDQPE